jgi:hypothetical protein
MCAGEEATGISTFLKKKLKLLKNTTIMKKTFVIASAIIAALTLTLASCTKETVIEAPAEEAIGFTSFTAIPTKAAVVRGEKLEAMYSKFIVKSFIDSTTTFMNSLAYTYNVQKANAWYYDALKDVKYWPNTGSINFYGYTESGFSTPTITPADQHLAITTEYSHLGVGDDILVAQCIRASKSDRDGLNSDAKPVSGSVPMKFKHALAQINFKLQNSNANTEVTVSEIQIQNVKHSAEVDFDGTTYTNTNPGVTYFIAAGSVFGTNGYKLTDSPVRIQENAGLCSNLMVPQVTSAWTKTSAADGARLAIKCKVVDATSQVVYQDGYVYIPLSINWACGKNYTYTIVFGQGAGYNADGEEILQVITFNPEVEDWTEATTAATTL